MYRYHHPGDRVIPRRAGHTLIELIVALAILALVTSLVGPRLMTPRPSSSEGLTDVIARARRMAVESGQAATLSVESSGDWSVRRTSRGDVTLMRGHLETAPEAMHLDLLPSGACLLRDGGQWDPSRCMHTRERQP